MADERKTLLNERLPAPSTTSLRGTPRERAVRRLQQLAKRASTAGAAVNLAACIGYGVVDPMPEPALCLDLDPTQWASAQATMLPDGTIQVELSGMQGAFFGEELDATGGIITSSDPPRDARAGASFLVIEISPNEGLIVVEFAMQCEGQPAALAVEIDPTTLSPDGGASVMLTVVAR